MDIAKTNSVDIATISSVYQTKATQPKQQPDSQAVEQSATPAAPVRPITDDQVSVTSVTLKNLDTVKSIEQMHAKMNQLVKNVRETNEVLNKAAEQVSQLQSNVTMIKNFPPFPADSQERQSLLMSYSAIRQEILKMSVPPVPASLHEQVKHLWDSVVGENGQIMASAVPALEADSSGAQVQDAGAQLDKTSNGLASLSSGITQALIGG